MAEEGGDMHATRGISRGRVLIVDDDQDFGETLALHLNRRGFEAESRSSGHDALALLDAKEFDVVLTDLSMCEMNGLVLCQRVAGLRPGLPVIVTTGSWTAEVRDAAHAAGAFEFLIKPFDLDELRRTLLRAVQSRRPS
jgi:DNA-binding NtrC family response regulator